MATNNPAGETFTEAAWRALGEDRAALRRLVAILRDIPVVSGDVSTAINVATLRLRDLCALIGDGR